MARVPYLDEADLAPEDRPLIASGIAFHRAMVNSPGARRAAAPLGRYIRHESPLDPRLRELAILQVGYLSRSAYEWSHHIKIGHAFGVSDADIEGLVAETEGRPSGLDPLTCHILRGAREMTRDLAMTDATWHALADALPRAHLVDLCLVIAQYNSVVRLLATLQIDVEPDYHRYLDRHPLPSEAAA